MKPLFAIALLGILALNACGRPETRLISTPAETTMSIISSTAASASPVPTGITPTPQATETSEATITPPSPPTPLPQTWKTFSHPGLNVTLRYPENWRLESASRASGSDGFFELATRSYQASEFDRLVNLCVMDANDPGQQTLFGPLPFIIDWQGWDVQRQAVIGYGCIVSPSESSGSQAVLYARDTRPEKPDQLLVLRADAAHFDGILSSLGFIKFGTQIPSSGYYDSPFCTETPKVAPVTTRREDGLLIEEYAIANATCDPWKHIDGFQTRIYGLSIDQGAIQTDNITTRLEAANRALAPFGYQLINHLSSNQTFDLLKGSDAIIKGFTDFGSVSVNAAGDNFILWVQDNYRSKPPIEVRSDGLHALDYWGTGFNTTWVGADLISFDYSSDKLFPVGAPAQVQISKNGSKIQAISIPQMGSAGSPVRGLWGWQGHWFMEIAGTLFQDGELQNLRLGDEEIFNWHLVNDKPFFFQRGRQAKTFELVYAGQTLTTRYDDIIHGDLCCDSSRYSIRNSPNGAQFYALRDGVWYLVSVKKTR